MWDKRVINARTVSWSLLLFLLSFHVSPLSSASIGARSTHSHGAHVHNTHAFALTRTAGTLKDAETRNRLQLDSTSRPAGHKTWPRLKRIASSLSISLSLSPRFSPLSSLLSHPSLASFSRCMALLSTHRRIAGSRNGRKKKENEKRRKLRLLDILMV